MSTSTNDAAAQLARDLDKMPSGEVIIERLLTAQVKLQRDVAGLQRENGEIKEQLHAALDKLQLLTALVDSDHAALLVLQGQRHQVSSGGIVH